MPEFVGSSVIPPYQPINIAGFLSGTIADTVSKTATVAQEAIPAVVDVISSVDALNIAQEVVELGPQIVDLSQNVAPVAVLVPTTGSASFFATLASKLSWGRVFLGLLWVAGIALIAFSIFYVLREFFRYLKPDQETSERVANEVSPQSPLIDHAKELQNARALVVDALKEVQAKENSLRSLNCESAQSKENFEIVQPKESGSILPQLGLAAILGLVATGAISFLRSFDKNKENSLEKTNLSLKDEREACLTNSDGSQVEVHDQGFTSASEDPVSTNKSDIQTEGQGSASASDNASQGQDMILMSDSASHAQNDGGSAQEDDWFTKVVAVGASLLGGAFFAKQASASSSSDEHSSCDNAERDHCNSAEEDQVDVLAQNSGSLRSIDAKDKIGSSQTRQSDANGALQAQIQPSAGSLEIGKASSSEVKLSGQRADLSPTDTNTSVAQAQSNVGSLKAEEKVSSFSEKLLSGQDDEPLLTLDANQSSETQTQSSASSLETEQKASSFSEKLLSGQDDEPLLTLDANQSSGTQTQSSASSLETEQKTSSFSEIWEWLSGQRDELLMAQKKPDALIVSTPDANTSLSRAQASNASSLKVEEKVSSFSESMLLGQRDELSVSKDGSLPTPDANKSFSTQTQSSASSLETEQKASSFSEMRKWLSGQREDLLIAGKKSSDALMVVPSPKDESLRTLDVNQSPGAQAQSSDRFSETGKASSLDAMKLSERRDDLSMVQKKSSDALVASTSDANKSSTAQVHSSTGSLETEQKAASFSELWKWLSGQRDDLSMARKNSSDAFMAFPSSRGEFSSTPDAIKSFGTQAQPSFSSLKTGQKAFSFSDAMKLFSEQGNELSMTWKSSGVNKSLSEISAQSDAHFLEIVGEAKKDTMQDALTVRNSVVALNELPAKEVSLAAVTAKKSSNIGKVKQAASFILGKGSRYGRAGFGFPGLALGFLGGWIASRLTEDNQEEEESTSLTEMNRDAQTQTESVIESVHGSSFDKPSKNSLDVDVKRMKEKETSKSHFSTPWMQNFPKFSFSNLFPETIAASLAPVGQASSSLTRAAAEVLSGPVNRQRSTPVASKASRTTRNNTISPMPPSAVSPGTRQASPSSTRAALAEVISGPVNRQRSTPVASEAPRTTRNRTISPEPVDSRGRRTSTPVTSSILSATASPGSVDEETSTSPILFAASPEPVELRGRRTSTPSTSPILSAAASPRSVDKETSTSPILFTASPEPVESRGRRTSTPSTSPILSVAASPGSVDKETSTSPILFRASPGPVESRGRQSASAGVRVLSEDRRHEEDLMDLPVSSSTPRNSSSSSIVSSEAVTPALREKRRASSLSGSPMVFAGSPDPVGSGGRDQASTVLNSSEFLEPSDADLLRTINEGIQLERVGNINRNRVYSKQELAFFVTGDNRELVPYLKEAIEQYFSTPNAVKQVDGTENGIIGKYALDVLKLAKMRMLATQGVLNFTQRRRAEELMRQRTSFQAMNQRLKKMNVERREEVQARAQHLHDAVRFGNGLSPPSAAAATAAGSSSRRTHLSRSATNP